MHENLLIAGELAYYLHVETIQSTQYIAQLNPGQLYVYDNIIAKVPTTSQDANFFIQGLAGTGKTFVYKYLCSHYCGKGKILLCVASSAISVLLLPGGRTAY